MIHLIVFNIAARRLKEEVLHAWMADPSPFVRRSLERHGWAFRQSPVYVDSDGEPVTCLYGYDDKGRLGFKADPGAPDRTDAQAGGDYRRLKRAAIDTLCVMHRDAPGARLH